MMELFLKIIQDGSISGDGIIVEMCGIKSLRNGLAKKKSKNKNIPGEVPVRHVRSWQNETVH